MWTHGEGQRRARGDGQPLPEEDSAAARRPAHRHRADVWVLALDAPPARSGVEVSEVVEAKPPRRRRFARKRVELGEEAQLARSVGGLDP